MFIPMFTFGSSELPRPLSQLAEAQFPSTSASTLFSPQACPEMLTCSAKYQCPLEFLLWILLQGGITEGGKYYPNFVSVELKK